MPTPTKPALRRFAVLIGIDDYSHYDVSARAEPGTHDLRGAVNDVRLMHRVCLRLGYDPDDIFTCTHPKLDPVDLGLRSGAANVRGATQAELQTVFRSLNGKIGAQRGAVGLVYFSGHGATDEESHLLVCPSDTELLDGKLVNVIDTTEVQHRLPIGVEVVLDCCHAGAGRNLTPSATTAQARPRFRSGDSMLAACQPDQMANERMLGGEWHGAFTYVLALLLEQWEVNLTGPRAWVAVTHETLRSRANTILRSLDLAQQPVYEGPPDMVFGMVPGAEDTTATSETRQMQIWSGDDSAYKYFQVVANGSQIGWYVTLGSSCPTSSLPANWRNTFQAGNEYWSWKASQDPFPAALTLAPQSTWDTSMPTATSAWTRLPCAMLATTPTVTIPAGNLYKVVAANTPSAPFYMKRTQGNPTTQTWYAAGGTSAKFVGDGASTVTFTTVSAPSGNFGKTILSES